MQFGGSNGNWYTQLMMNLVIDIGNTCAKTALFEDGKLMQMHRYEQWSVRDAGTWLCGYPVSKCLLSSVSDDSKELADALADQLPVFIQLSHRLAFPFKILYRTPETLGNDRIAAVAGAYNRFPGKQVLVIDMGTAITFEMITASGEYTGGTISPGLMTRFRALHTFTARLPLVENRETDKPMGDDTVTAILAGVQQGILFELQGYIDTWARRFPGLQVVMTGGDTAFFENKLKRPIFVCPNLVLEGLNCILEYNAPTENR